MKIALSTKSAPFIATGYRILVDGHAVFVVEVLEKLDTVSEIGAKEVWWCKL